MSELLSASENDLAGVNYDKLGSLTFFTFISNFALFRT